MTVYRELTVIAATGECFGDFSRYAAGARGDRDAIRTERVRHSEGARKPRAPTLAAGPLKEAA